MSCGWGRENPGGLAGGGWESAQHDGLSMVFKVCKLFAYFMLRRFAMEATVAERGQITLPKAVRDALGLSKGTILKVELEGGRIILRKSVDDAISRALEIGRASCRGRVGRYG